MNTVCSIFVGWIVLLIAFGNLNVAVVVIFLFACFFVFFFLFVCIFSRFLATQQKNNDESEKSLRLKR